MVRGVPDVCFSRWGVHFFFSCRILIVLVPNKHTHVMHVHFLCVSHMLFFFHKKKLVFPMWSVWCNQTCYMFLLLIWHIFQHPSIYTKSNDDNLVPGTTQNPFLRATMWFDKRLQIFRYCTPLFHWFILGVWRLPDPHLRLPNVKPKLSARMSGGNETESIRHSGLHVKKHSSIQPCVCSSTGGDSVGSYTQLCAGAMFTNTPTFTWVN